MAVGATPLHPDFATIPPAERHRFFAGLRAAGGPAFLPYTATEGFYASALHHRQHLGVVGHPPLRPVPPVRRAMRPRA
jgi:hypothetical protein